MDSSGELVVQLVIMGIFGAITSAIAASKGRNALGWFFVGFFFSCIGLIVALCVSDLKAEQERWAAAETEQRRLREQLRQERIKSESYRQQVDGRLDLHDEALGMNTRQIAHAGNEPARLESEQSAKADEDAPVEFIRQDEAEALEPGSFPNREWRVRVGSHRSGAISFNELKRQFASGEIDEHTEVWSTGMLEWQLIGDMPDLLQQLSGRG